MNWYEIYKMAIKENKIKKEAGIKENVITTILATLFLLPFDAFIIKNIRSREPGFLNRVEMSDINIAKEIKEKVESGKSTEDEKSIYDNANILKNEIKAKNEEINTLKNKSEKNNLQKIDLGDLAKIIIVHEGLLPHQTPFRITNEKMRKWDTIHGFLIDKFNPNREKRQNFIFLKKQEDVYPAVIAQLKKYITNPAKYELPPNPTLKDMIYKFDQSNPKGKMNYIKQKMPNINFDIPAINYINA